MNGAKTRRQSAVSRSIPAIQNSRLKTSFIAQKRGYLSPLSLRLSNEACSFSASTCADLLGATYGISVGSSGRRYPTCVWAHCRLVIILSQRCRSQRYSRTFINGPIQLNVSLLKKPAFTSAVMLGFSGTGGIGCHRNGLNSLFFLQNDSFFAPAFPPPSNSPTSSDETPPFVS